jgi:hypothetical protein
MCQRGMQPCLLRLFLVRRSVKRLARLHVFNGDFRTQLHPEPERGSRARAEAVPRGTQNYCVWSSRLDGTLAGQQRGQFVFRVQLGPGTEAS